MLTDLPLMEYFLTIQGEGYHTGSAAYFIRLGGCDVGCVWCDVKESWDADAHSRVPLSQMVADAKASGSEIVVITGGEPLMYDLGDFTNQLHDAGLKTHIETSGAHPLSGDWDWICLSPKKRKPPVSKIYSKAHELKVIVYNKSDFKFAEEHAKKVSKDCILYLQPEWSVSEKITPLIVEYVMKHPKWKISLQTHKYLNIP